ncbi:iron-siderophore ABC transporter substrate-binding protein, partial [Rothia mucilaginosa]
VILSTGQLDGVLSLGVVPVGAATAGDADLVPTYLKTKFSDKSAELDKIAKVGKRTDPDVEAIANLKPDLILINNTNKKDELYESLAKIAPTVVTEGTGVNWKQDFLLIAAALGTTEKAEKLMEEYNTKAKSVGQKAGSEKTFSFLYASADRTRIFAKSSFVGSICADASLARPAAAQVEKTSIDLSSEQLDQADGDYLFYGVQGGDESKLTGEALWSTLKAVTGKHAHSVDSDMFFLNAGPAAALGVLETIEKAL